MARVSVVQQETLRDASGKAIGRKFTVTGAGSFTIQAADLGAVVAAEALWHGIGQKVGDAAAKDMGTPPSEKYAAMRKVADQITGTDGVWTARGEGDNAILVAAIARVSDITVEQARAAFDGWDADTQAAIKKDPSVVKAQGAIRAEQAAARAKVADPVTVKAAQDALAKLKAMTGPGAGAKKAA